MWGASITFSLLTNHPLDKRYRLQSAIGVWVPFFTFAKLWNKLSLACLIMGMVHTITLIGIFLAS